MVYAKKAFSPMPGASTKGNLAYIAITAVPTMAEMIVVVNTAPLSIPASARMLGFTARIYAIVRNVVIPARTSLFTVIVFGSNPKIF
jgi:hypothetical protein